MNKIFAAAVLAAAACLCAAQPASARPYHRAHYAAHRQVVRVARRAPEPAREASWGGWNWGAPEPAKGRGQKAAHLKSAGFWDAPAENVYRNAPARVSASEGLPGPCRQAARMGGPCGCWAEYTLFGRLEHVVGGWNAWLAASWLPSGGHSQRVGSVAEANAAVYLSRGGRAYHVAPIVGGVARDSFGDHPVSGNVVLVRASI